MKSEREFSGAGPIERIWLMFERLINAFSASEYNPFYYLGAICVFFLWVILVTGVYLFFFYSISARGAYDSVQAITVNQWYLGGVMRSMHRYASDALVVAGLLHAIRCYALDRYRHWRWLAWVSGVAIMWIIWIGGIFGYWMVWDERAKLVATLSSHMIERIPIFGLPLSLNFARIESLTDQLFYIILFIHFSTLFFLFILIMIHISRITKSIINPPRAIAWGLVIILFALSALMPAASGPPADLKRLAGAVPFDWLYMFIFPLMKFASERLLWLFIVSVTLIVSIVPWLSRTRRKPAVEVTLENCTGCELCMEDCPYEAIRMRPRTDGLSYPLEAVTVPDRCASCGICVGSCDYKALNLPDMTEDSVKGEIKRLSAVLKGAGADAKIIVFCCAKGPWLDGMVEDGGVKGFPGTGVVNLPCIGMLQPSMISIPFDMGVDGVFIAGCRQGDCHYRTGNSWLTGRIAGHRPPVVKKSIDRSRLKSVWLSSVESEGFLKDLGRFQKHIKDLRRSA